MYYIAMDGGGTKLAARLFDENGRILASARAKGTHFSIYSHEAVAEHIRTCYAQLFAGIETPLRIETMYVICGSADLMMTLLPSYVTLGGITCIGESPAGLYAGLCRREGFLVLAGTGSDAFCIKDSECVDVVGGWGALLGDEGSGVWLSREAIGAAIRTEQGWSEPTRLDPHPVGSSTRFAALVKEAYGLKHLWDYVAKIYADPAPFRFLADLLPLVGQAAREGDPAMQEIFRRGGILLARQIAVLLRRHPEMEPRITACGGAWKAHPLLSEAFRAAIADEFPAAVFTLPQFEHIMAGPICLLMERGMKPSAIADHLIAVNPAHEVLWNA